MEVEYGCKYLVEGSSDIGEFSKAILLLTNLKANNEEVIEFRTFYGSNKIRIIAFSENDSYVESNIGKIITKEKCTIVRLTEDDFKQHVVEQLDKSYDNDEDIEVMIDIF